MLALQCKSDLGLHNSIYEHSVQTNRFTFQAVLLEDETKQAWGLWLVCRKGWNSLMREDLSLTSPILPENCISPNNNRRAKFKFIRNVLQISQTNKHKTKKPRLWWDGEAGATYPPDSTSFFIQWVFSRNIDRSRHGSLPCVGNKGYHLEKTWKKTPKSVVSRRILIWKGEWRKRRINGEGFILRLS